MDHSHTYSNTIAGTPTPIKPKLKVVTIQELANGYIIVSNAASYQHGEPESTYVAKDGEDISGILFGKKHGILLGTLSSKE